MNKNILFIVILFVISCSNEKCNKDYLIVLKSDLFNGNNQINIPIVNEYVYTILDKITLLSKDKNSYIYDISTTKSYIAFLDNTSDTILSIYNKNSLSAPQFFYLKKKGLDQIQTPCFTKEVRYASDTIHVIDLDLYKKTFILTTDKIELLTDRFSEEMIHSSSYNLATSEIYASPFNRTKTHSFYFFNQDSGYYWVKPSATISKMQIKNPDLYSNYLCVNEKRKTIAVAYRYINYISFYDLEGKHKLTVTVGRNSYKTKISLDKKELSMQETNKYFIEAQGTSLYLYCLYDGTNDFSAQSKIIIFDWTGKYIKTLQFNHSVSTFSVNNDDKYIIVASNKDSGGQNIIKYNI